MSRVHRNLLVAIALVVAVTPLLATPALAQVPLPNQTVGIRLVDAPTNRANDPRAHEYIVDHVAPGSTISRRIEISNDTAAPQVIQLYAAAAGITAGNFQFGAGRAVNDLTTWTTVDPSSVNLARGAKSPATVAIVVPANASAGERYAVVWAELPTAVPPGGGVSAVNRVGVRIYLSVGEGGEPASEFAITAFEARRDRAGNPLVAATVHNTGGRAVDLSGELSLSNGPAGLSAGPFQAKLGTTLGIGQTEPVSVSLNKAIPAGPWDAHIVLRSGTTERDASAKITFPPSGSSGPVTRTTGGASGSSLLPVLIGVAVLIALLVLIFLVVRRRPS